MYVDSINNSFGNQSVISGFCNTLICSSNASDSEKIITVPNGYTNTDAYVTIRVLFLNGYYDTSTISNPMTLTVQHEDGTYFDGTSTPTSYPIKSYQNGVLDNLQIHEITQTDYRVIDPNTCIELYFDGTQFVVVGNPLVLSSSDYSIYANGLTIQFFKTTTNNNTPDASFPIAFKSNVISINGTITDMQSEKGCSCWDVTKTGFKKCSGEGSHVFWTAIGY
jgi:hypothetical protein